MDEWQAVNGRAIISGRQPETLAAAVLDRCAVALDVSIYQTIDSTNDWSLSQCGAGKSLPFACFAENQTHGKGRRGKRWLTLPGAGIAMSLSWAFESSGQSLHLLSLSVAIAVVKSLESLGIKHVQIKWPNDIFVGGEKIAGILIETRPLKSAIGFNPAANPAASKANIAVVIGVGLNYDMQKMLASMPEAGLPALTDICSQVDGCLKNTGSREITRATVATELLVRVVAVCQNYQSDAKSYLRQFREKYDYCLYKRVEVIQADGVIVEGVAQGVNDCAELLVNITDGSGNNGTHTFNSAEVSVKAAEKNDIGCSVSD